MKIKKNLALMVLAVALVFAATVATTEVCVFLPGRRHGQLADPGHRGLPDDRQRRFGQTGRIKRQILLKPENRLNMSKMPCRACRRPTMPSP
jgi:hypothetical protein